MRRVLEKHRPGFPLGAFASAVTLAVALTLGFSSGTPASAAGPTTVSYTAVGSATFVVPAGVTSVHVVAQGSAGSNSNAPGGTGGAGARVTADIPVIAGATYQIEVGAGGGGGNYGGGAGGGLAGLYTCTGMAASCAVVVAGGGGGGGYYGQGIFHGGWGGDAGSGSLLCNPGTNGINSVALYTTSGGASGACGAGGSGGAGGGGGQAGTAGVAGSGGKGGNGSYAPAAAGAGGGGGGYYGGGGGGGGWFAGGGYSGGAGGGGGSSFVQSGASNVSMVLAPGTASVTITFEEAPPPPPVVVYTSNSDVDTWDPIFPASVDGSWPSTVCVPTPAVGLGAAWTNPHKATSFGTGAHPWQGGAGFTAEWINAWTDMSSRGAGGHSWTKYSTPVTGNGAFVLNLLADNCSWIYLDGALVGFQDASLTPRTYPVTLSGAHTLEFIIFDGGGLAGGMYRLETNAGAVVFPDTDDDGLDDPVEHLYGTDPNDPDSDDDGVSDGDEVAAGTDPLAPPTAPSTTTVTFGPGPFVYNGSAFTATSTVSPSGTATIVYTGDCTNAGNTCTATATFAGTPTLLPSSAAATITIDQAPSVTTVTGGGIFSYDGSSHPLTATVTGAGGLNQSVPATGCVASPTDAADSCTGTATFAGDANHTGSSASATVTINPAPTTTSVTFGPGPFPYTGSAYTATASVSPAAAGSATVAYTGDCTNGGSTCTATATFAGSANYLPSVSAPASITITYTICDGAGGDTSPAKNSGSTIPVKVKVCASGGANVGSTALVVTAVGITPSASLADSGKANPGNLFRFDDGQYIFNLSTKGFAAGAYTLDYTVGNDPTVYHYAFVVRSR